MSVGVTLKSFGATDVGRRRKHNEDYIIINKDVGLYAVADGVGGHQAGELASQMTLEGLLHRLLSRPDLFGPQARRQPLTQRKKSEIKQFLDRAIQSISFQIFTLSQQRGPDFRMGSTITALIDLGEIGAIVHVGDSRCYLLRGDVVYQLTEDHSLIAEQLKRGLITVEEAKKSRYRNVITRAVGMADRLPVDIFFVDLVPGDRFLLCTDGFYTYLKQGEINGFLKLEELEKIPELAIQLANNRGGKDNISVIVLAVEGVSTVKKGLSPTVVDSIYFLRQSPLFRGLTHPEALKILALSTHRNYQKGDVIMNQGDPPSNIYLVISGELGIYSGGEIIAKLGKGDYVGEMGVFDGAPSSATVIADSPTQCLVIHGKEFLHLLRQASDLGFKIQHNLILELIRRLRRTSSALAWTRQEWRKTAEADFYTPSGSLTITVDEEEEKTKK